MSILSKEIVGHSPLCSAADAKSLRADKIEQSPVEEPSPPFGAIGSLEDGRHHGAVVVHPLEPGVERLLVMGTAHSPVILNPQVGLEVEKQRMRRHSTA